MRTIRIACGGGPRLVIDEMMSMVESMPASRALRNDHFVKKDKIPLSKRRETFLRGVLDVVAVHLSAFECYMITPTPTISDGLTSRPTRQIVKAAQVAASSHHALVNLVRLVRALDSNDPEGLAEQSNSTGEALPTSTAFKKDREVRLLAVKVRNADV